MRAATAVLAIAALGAAAAPAAGASTVSFDGNGTLVVTAGDERNRIGLQPWEDGRIVIYEGAIGATVTSATPACEQEYDYSVTCTWNPAAGARMDLGGGDDDGYVSSGLPPTAPFALAGGAGADTLAADVQATTLDGGAGNDVLKGADGADTLSGGEGDDDISGNGGADALSGSGGDDKLSGDGIEDPAGDVIDGGAGTDTIDSDWSDPTYFAVEKPIAVTLAGGADDGRTGEGDDIRGVERITAYQEARLVGTDAAEYLEVFQVLASGQLVGNGGADTLRGADGPDSLDGGAGADDLDAGFGDDVIVGGPGQDSIAGDRRGGDCGPLWCKYPYGNDTIDARDGERDSVTCGAGEDAVKADAADVVDASCEKVDRAGGNGPGPGPGHDPRNGKRRLALTAARATVAGGIRLRLAAPAAGRLKASAAVKGRVVGSGARKVRKAGTTTVVLRFARKARRHLRAGTKVTVAVRFTPKRGVAMTGRLRVKLGA